MRKLFVLVCLMLTPLTLAAEIDLTVDGVIVSETASSTFVAIDWSAESKGEQAVPVDVDIVATIYDSSGTVLGTTTLDMSVSIEGCRSCVSAGCSPCVYYWNFGGIYDTETFSCFSDYGPCQDGTSSVCVCHADPTAGPSLEVGVTGGASVKVELDYPDDMSPGDNSLTVSY